MAKKISQLPQDTAPTVTDSVPTYDIETLLTKRVLISDLITLFFNNIPAGAHSDVTRGDETMFDHVVPNTGVWTADAAGSTRLASMTAATVYLNGRRLTIGAVTSRTFAASVDTYIDVLDNLDGTGTLVYTTAVNNAASAALAANSVRIGIIVTGATTIAAASSVNQGQLDRVLPIASSRPYTLTDSLGNLICNRSPSPTLIGYGRLTGTQAGVTTEVARTGLAIPVIVPAGRQPRITWQEIETSSSVNTIPVLGVYRGTAVSGTLIEDKTQNINPLANIPGNMLVIAHDGAAATGINTYSGSVTANNSMTFGPTRFRVEI